MSMALVGSMAFEPQLKKDSQVGQNGMMGECSC